MNPFAKKIANRINTYKYNKRARKKNEKLVKFKDEILQYYSSSENISEDQLEVISYLKKNPLHVFPYSYVDSYNYLDIEVFHDPAFNNLPYVLHEGKKLFFKRKKNDIKIMHEYSFLCLEQDERSPHRYLTNTFTVKDGDVVIDIGSAEGNFALSIIEKVKKIYLFEVEPQWVEGLKATFAPWKDKVEIINKYVSDTNDETNVSLDALFKNDEVVNFIKIDVEGAEKRVLDGAAKLLERSKNINIALCTYHKQTDAEEFKQILEDKQFNIEFTKGYMIFINENLQDFKAPYLRKGLIRATKE